VFKEMLKDDDPILDRSSIAEFAARNAQLRTLTLEGYAKARADSIGASSRQRFGVE
jgi:hypothetical protein